MDTELQQLKDIHLPPPIHHWLIAPGWIMVWTTLFVFFVYSIWYWYRQRQKRYTVKFALRRLDALKNLLKNNPENINVAAEISTLIRRTSLHYFPRGKVAGLSGNAWLDFLNNSGNKEFFTDATGKLLTDAPYRQESAAGLMPLFDATQAWLQSIAKKKVEK